MTNKDLECELENAVAELERLEAENQRLKDANRWIPVSERLPAHNREYLVTLQIGSAGRPFTGICRFYATAFESANGFGSVVAWQELPEPYQGDL